MLHNHFISKPLMTINDVDKAKNHFSVELERLIRKRKEYS